VKDRVYKHYLLGVLLLITAHNFVERTTLGLLLQDIKTDLALSDTQLGFLTGIAFAVFYSLMGIPIARWADRGNRIAIVTLTTALWSAAVALCGLARNFTQLLLIRVGVAVGEAGCLPPAHSLIADHFARAERPRAVAIYMLGAPFGMLLGYLSAGWLNELYGWRVTFMLLGVPGLALAALAGLTLKEPRRTISVQIAMPDGLTAHPASFKRACVALWANATFRNVWLGLSVQSLFGYGIMQWMPAFFIRSFGLTTAQVGTWFAIIYGLGGLLGTYLGGMLAARYAAHNERLQLRFIALAFVVFAILSACVYVSSNAHVAFTFLALAMIGGCTMNGPLFATIQTVVPDRMRATAIAIVYLFSNLIGMGLGPLAVGALSDAFRPWAGEESLRYALLLLCPGYVFGVWYVWKASTTVNRDLEEVSRSCHYSS
jgi:MFS family permease